VFVGRQYHFEVDGDDFYIDLLFFNRASSSSSSTSAGSSQSTPASSAATSPGSDDTCAVRPPLPHRRHPDPSRAQPARRALRTGRQPRTARCRRLQLHALPATARDTVRTDGELSTALGAALCDRDQLTRVGPGERDPGERVDAAPPGVLHYPGNAQLVHGRAGRPTAEHKLRRWSLPLAVSAPAAAAVVRTRWLRAGGRCRRRSWRPVA